MSSDPQALLDALERRNQHAVRLATLASAAVQIEPELLRALRLRIPNADAGAEADVWFSDLVESRSTLGVTLRADVRDALQKKLALDPGALDIVAEVFLRMHANVSDVIRIEEQVTLECLRSEPGAQGRIDSLLAPVVATLERQRHRGLARWAIRAFDSMPALAKETESVWRLMRASSVTRAAAGTSPRDSVEAALGDLPRLAVRLRLRKDLLEIQAARRWRVWMGPSDLADDREVISALEARGFDVLTADAARDTADAYVLNVGIRTGAAIQTEFGYARNRGIPVVAFTFSLEPRRSAMVNELLGDSQTVTLSDPQQLQPSIGRLADQLLASHFSSAPGDTISIPETAPLMLEVAWDDNQGRQSRRLTLQPGETVQQPLRPRNVTVTAINGEAYAIEPELELDHHAILIGIDKYEYADLVAPASENSARMFHEWLVARGGGRLPEENVHDVRTGVEFDVALEAAEEAQRIYLYFAGAAQEPAFLLFADGVRDVSSVRDDLRNTADQIVLVIESAWDRTPDFVKELTASTNENELLLVNNVREGPLLPRLLEALSGGAGDAGGTITAGSVMSYVLADRPTQLWASAGDFVLRKNVFTIATFHFPREMFGAKMHLTPASGDAIAAAVGDAIELIVRPTQYELAIPEHEYYKSVTFRPGHNDIQIGWRWNGKWVIVAGTADPLLDGDLDEICEAVARSLADHGFGLFVGSYAGVDELAAHVFVDRVHFLGGGATEVFRQYVQASTKPQFKAARTVTVEDDYDAPLAEASALIVLGGADGVMEYAKRARKHRVPVVSIAETGGAAAKLAREPIIEPARAAKDIARTVVEQIEAVTGARSSPPYPTPM